MHAAAPEEDGRMGDAHTLFVMHACRVLKIVLRHGFFSNHWPQWEKGHPHVLHKGKKVEFFKKK